MNVKIGIVEDDSGVREQLQKLLERTPGFSCMGAWESGESALPAILQDLPDIVLMDVHLPGMSGIECVAESDDGFDSINFNSVNFFENGALSKCPHFRARLR